MSKKTKKLKAEIRALKNDVSILEEALRDMSKEVVKLLDLNDLLLSKLEKDEELLHNLKATMQGA